MKKEMLQKLKELKDKIEEMSPEEVADLYNKTQEGQEQNKDNQYAFLEKMLLRSFKKEENDNEPN